jgi:hypothetical protein
MTGRSDYNRDLFILAFLKQLAQVEPAECNWVKTKRTNALKMWKYIEMP